MKVNSVDKE